jgi:ribosomal protein S12 methylthiotransferase
MPIQHASARVLERMRRPERAERLREKIAWLRSEIPELTLRTTVLVGFPGEGEEDFEELLEFIAEIQFDHLGAFAYSPQKGTPGAELADHVPEPVKLERLARVNETQRSIVAGRNLERVGRWAEVLVDSVGGAEIIGRVCGQAYEIDGVTYLRAPQLSVAPGDLLLTKVTGADDADLWADAESLVRSAPRPPERAAAAGLDLRTAWGR